MWVVAELDPLCGGKVCSLAIVSTFSALAEKNQQKRSPRLRC
jgi:hypothetical protein